MAGKRRDRKKMTPPQVQESAIPSSVLQNLTRLSNTGKWQAMEDLAHTMIQSWPSHPLGWKALGAALHNKGDSRQALPALEKAVALDPRDTESRHNLAKAQQEIGQRAEALETLRPLLAQSPNDPALHFQYALLLKWLGREEDATHHRQIAQRLNPLLATGSTPLPQAEVVAALRTQFSETADPAEQRSLLLRWLELAPTDGTALEHMARLEAETGTPRGAAESYLSLVLLRPEESDLLQDAAAAFVEEGRFFLALCACKRLIDENPNNEELKEVFTELYQHAKQTGEVLRNKIVVTDLDRALRASSAHRDLFKITPEDPATAGA